MASSHPLFQNDCIWIREAQLRWRSIRQGPDVSVRGYCSSEFHHHGTWWRWPFGPFAKRDGNWSYLTTQTLQSSIHTERKVTQEERCPSTSRGCFAVFNWPLSNLTWPIQIIYNWCTSRTLDTWFCLTSLGARHIVDWLIVWQKYSCMFNCCKNSFPISLYIHI